MSRERYVAVGNRWVPINEAAATKEYGTMIMPDLTPFRSPDGAFITSRSTWREHLKRTDSIEMTHSDVASAQQNWNKRRQSFQDRLKFSAQAVVDASQNAGEIRPIQRTGLNVEIANRLHGRPAPERKELIKLSLDIAKRMNRG
jgi:hypothetical protein